MLRMIGVREMIKSKIIDHIVKYAHKNKKIISYLAIAIFLFITGYINIPGRLSIDDVYLNFDMHSENIMVSDLMYHENYNNSIFLKVITPTMKVYGNNISSHILNNPEEITDTYINSKVYDENNFKDYDSNLCMHRYFYHIVSDVLGNHKMTLIFLHFINIFLFSVVLAYILCFFAQKTSYITAVITAIVLGLVCPSFFMFAKNLYWIPWTLFLPMLGSIFVVNRFEKKGKSNYLFAFTITILTCLLKQVVYYEFLTTAMIAMMIPYLFYLLEHKKSLKTIIRFFILMISAALISFIVTAFIKGVFLYAQSGSINEALSGSIDLIRERMFGIKSGKLNELQKYATDASHLSVLVVMLKKAFISIKGIGFLTFLSALGLLLIQTCIYLIIRKYPNRVYYIFHMDNNKCWIWLVIIYISLLAPLSWFVMAKFHTAIHHIHSSITWFCPFAVCFLIFEIEIIWRKIENVLLKQKEDN